MSSDERIVRVLLGRLESLRLVQILRTQLRSGDGHVHDGTGMEWSKCSVARAKVQGFALTVEVRHTVVKHHTTSTHLLYHLVSVLSTLQ